MNCAGLLRDAVATRPHQVALLQDDVRLAYGELDRRANCVANALAGLGIGRGAHVAVLVRNDLRYVEAVFGILRAGAVAVPVTTRADFATLHHVLSDSGVCALIASTEFAEEARRLRDEIETLGHLWIMDESERALDYDTWRESAADTPMLAPAAGNDTAMLCYTSGSTGLPKGVTLSHAGIDWCARTMRQAMLLGPRHRCLLAVPLFHANATTCGLWPMFEGGGSVVIQRDFDAQAVLRGLSAYDCTYTTGVPAMYKLMLREADLLASLSFPALEFVLCSSSEVPEALLDAFTAAFGVPMIEGYGLTEGGPMVLSNPRWGIAKPGTSGLPLPGVDILVVERDDPTVGVECGRIGELLVRSPGVTHGYHRLPNLSAERLLAGGWLRTKDLVRRDADGYVTVVGRLDDLIICGGENIYPTEVENRLIAHHAVGDVAVVSRPDEVKGEVPVAFVVPRAGADPSEDDIKRYALANGPAYAHPRAVYMLDELPLTASKKVDRAALARTARDRHAQDWHAQQMEAIE